jgi:redox-sensitive bicupin YhaK (pirin superfamily)
MAIEITADADAVVGDLRVRRALPRRPRRTVGAWCFADHMGPAELARETDLIGPHPHIGLQTVTWLLEGQALHRDSLGSEQVIKAGQLNLMTAGHGVVHSEEATGHYAGTLEGIQLWIAQPDQTRNAGNAFEHHASLPRFELDNGAATVLVGTIGDTSSPAKAASPLVGVELDLRAGTTVVPLDPAAEHAVIVLRGELSIDGDPLGIGQLGYIAPGRDELGLDSSGTTRAMLLGGEPFDEQVVMWWNFVARSREEIIAAYRSWQSGDERFTPVASQLARIPAPTPPWL